MVDKPGYVTSSKTDTYEGPAFKIEHTYWDEYKGTNGGGYIGSQLKVTNTADVPINIRLYLDLDDTGIFWDANVRAGDGTPMENKWIEVGTIQPKASIEKGYWWGVFNQAGLPYAENFEVTFNMAPVVTIDYNNYKAFNQSKSRVSTEAD
jgi:hypothetical protein